ncbi:hypothetical protein A3750_21045, partial [Oleiphilus sp. HI0079]|uniref:glutaredoxin family protein n=2 Tax=Oleiphilus TaxID=141450 RepID=UPI0007C2CC10
NVQLLGTEGCHLCDLAASVLGSFNSVMESHNFSLSIELVDISASEAMVERYGALIPVVIDVGSGRALSWPFDEQAVYEFLRVCDGAV